MGAGLQSSTGPCPPSLPFAPNAPVRLPRRRLIRLVGRADILCLHLVEAFDDGPALLTATERHGLEGVVSKRRDAPYRSGVSRDWVKVKTAAWREANRERWRMFERPGK